MEKGDGGFRGEGESPFSALHPKLESILVSLMKFGAINPYRDVIGPDNKKLRKKLGPFIITKTGAG
jgi:hypothetical protein